MDRDAQLALLDKAVRANIASWQDIYDTLNSVYAFASNDRTVWGMSVALMWHRAFTRALELLPEEGDALVIGLQMSQVIINELTLTSEEATAQMLGEAVSAIFTASQANDAETPINGPSVGENTAKKPILH